MVIIIGIIIIVLLYKIFDGQRRKLVGEELNKAKEEYDKSTEAVGKSIVEFMMLVDKNSEYYADDAQGKLSEYITDCNQAIRNDPKLALSYIIRAKIYCKLKEYDKTWADVHKAGELGYIVNSNFLDGLKKASGRDK